MLLLGLDIGTSSIKASVVESESGSLLAAASYPETEAPVLVPHPGWAEQDPESWWQAVQQAVLACHATKRYAPEDIAAIGIAYQMHGLVMVDRDQKVLRNAIIWCDSRAVDMGNRALDAIGKERCLSHLLNAPGNFTASKLAWVKANEPAAYGRMDQIMLPGDYIAMRLTGAITTTVSALSEGVFWDFQTQALSEDIFHYYGFDQDCIPSVQAVFSDHGRLTKTAAEALSLMMGTPVTYKAGDQPNNALALNVMAPGEVAATAGTSGVIYGISDQLIYDRASRINSFAHVNHQGKQNNIGVLLCINGTGIFNHWVRTITGGHWSYEEMNQLAGTVRAGADGLFALPFGNGAERMLNNRVVGAYFFNLDFNVHTPAHVLRAVQEGIAFSFRYGLDIMRENGISPRVIRASQTNLFQSPLFAQAFADVNNVRVEFYAGDGSYGAAIGAGIGAGVYRNVAEASMGRKPVGQVDPRRAKDYDDLYFQWKERLEQQLQSV